MALSFQEIEQMEKNNPGSSMMKILNEVAGSQPIIKALLEIKSGVAKVRRSPITKTMTNTEKLEFQNKLRDGISQDLTNVMLQVKNQHKQTIEKAQEAYQTYRRTHTDQVNLQVNDDNLKYSAMSAAELKAVAQKIAGGQEDFSPEAVDVISRELKAIDPEEHEFLREQIKANNYHSPWLRTEEGRAATEAIKYIDQSIKHGSQSVPYQDPETGNYAGVSVHEIIGGVE